MDLMYFFKQWASCMLSRLLFFLLIYISECFGLPGELEVIIDHVPDHCEDFARLGDTVYVDYTGLLKDGRVFDASVLNGRGPASFQIGSGHVVKGWEKGMIGMCIGEKRKLIIPPHLGYGSQGFDDVIPGDASLFYHVHLVNVERDSIFDKFLRSMAFFIWPLGLFLLVYYCYHKVAKALTKDRMAVRRLKRKRL
ncbi:FK506-binding protein 2 isoform X3 [Hydra vulgaris]|uniref:peptidylprolyl isomerase n=1 Tax=Hydra vulgaris TaxID=6087 RepID=A0ABM4BRT3_HYDVU